MELPAQPGDTPNINPDQEPTEPLTNHRHRVAASVGDEDLGAGGADRHPGRVGADGDGKLEKPLRRWSEWFSESGAKGIRTPDLLDANESTWALVLVSPVDSASKSLVRALMTLANDAA
jgi:hypothetical protein